MLNFPFSEFKSLPKISFPDTYPSTDKFDVLAPSVLNNSLLFIVKYKVSDSLLITDVVVV